MIYSFHFFHHGGLGILLHFVWEEGKEWNEKNHFGIFIPFTCLEVLVEGMERHSFVWESKWEGRKYVKWKHSFLPIPQNLKISFLLKLGENVIKFNNILLKLPKYPIHLVIYLKIRVL